MQINLRTMAPPLALQLLHLLLACAWNVLGLWRLAQGEPAPGPSASWLAVGALVCLSIALVLGVMRWPILYWVASAVIVIAVAPAIWGAFVRDAADWSTPRWRWGGALLNTFGVASAVWGCLRLRRLRST
ncbi:hypothetical protein [Rhodoferax sp. TH121]|uniref:hypothetical protein n=1 Tax=Rhodoferax sp. TH121 TaxID=2022803 RepID=UPI0015952688|nr:hypothetical protein [Rhodoferax sp. TH121]